MAKSSTSLMTLPSEFDHFDIRPKISPTICPLVFIAISSQRKFPPEKSTVSKTCLTVYNHHCGFSFLWSRVGLLMGLP